MILSGQKTTTRRQFVSRSALLTGGISLGLNSAAGNLVAETETAFSAYQQRRRADLWGLLGDLPWEHEPAPPKLVRREEHDRYTLERLVLDLNGIEPVPALLLIPKGLERPAPGLAFIHWHAGMYDLGKEQLLKGTSVQPAYAPVLAEMGIVTLAIDSWCFGERQHDSPGGFPRSVRGWSTPISYRGVVIFKFSIPLRSPPNSGGGSMSRSRAGSISVWD